MYSRNKKTFPMLMPHMSKYLAVAPKLNAFSPLENKSFHILNWYYFLSCIPELK